MGTKRQEAINKLRQILLRRREALRRALAGDLSALREVRGSSGGDIADAASDAVQNEISCQLAEVEARELAQIEAALERMRNGTYGICEVTGKPIPLARLQALPYATMCIEAQRELEKRSRRGSPSADWSRVVDSTRDEDSDWDSEAVLNDLEND
jgi:DnaK suppressor protein